MKRILQTMGVLALGLAATGGAQVMSLTDLFAGGSIQVNDKLLDQWELTLQTSPT